MSYRIIEPPSSTYPVPKEDQKKYLDWYTGAISCRIRELVDEVTFTSGYAWRHDFTLSSLEELGLWFEAQVEIRPRTTKEIAALDRVVSIPTRVPTVELTDRTLSLAFDVGMYFSQALLQELPGLKWQVEKRRVDDVNYGLPVLVSAGPVCFCPINVFITFAHGLADGRREGREIVGIFQKWCALLKQ